MKRLNWSFSAGIVILASGMLALFLSAGVLKAVRAQGPPAMDLPPPQQQMPQGPGPQQGQMPQQNQQQGAQPAQNNLPPPPDEGLPPQPGMTGEGPAVLDASQDPGLRTSNPEGYVYDPSGRRDPFLPPKSMMGVLEKGPVTPVQGPIDPQMLGNMDPLLTYYLKDFRLIGILWDVRQPRAMLRAPNNRVYTVQLKSKIGRENAVIAAIREKEVVVVEPDEKGNYKNGEARVLKLRN